MEFTVYYSDGDGSPEEAGWWFEGPDGFPSGPFSSEGDATAAAIQDQEGAPASA
jgi:hypothetical protein